MNLASILEFVKVTMLTNRSVGQISSGTLRARPMQDSFTEGHSQQNLPTYQKAVETGLAIHPRSNSRPTHGQTAAKTGSRRQAGFVRVNCDTPICRSRKPASQ